jgi:hypothetical protein
MFLQALFLANVVQKKKSFVPVFKKSHGRLRMASRDGNKRKIRDMSWIGQHSSMLFPCPTHCERV